MIYRIIRWLAHTTDPGGHKKKTSQLLVFLLFLSPLFVIAALHFTSVYQSLTDLSLERRQSMSLPVALALEEHLNRLVNTGISFSIHPKIREAILEERWNDAIELLRLFNTVSDDTIIDRIFLADASGVLQAGIPEKGTEGKDFSFRDWYQGARSTGQPYVSKAYQRTVEPRFQVVAVAIPIPDESGDTATIMVLQVRLDRFFDWVQKIEIGHEGLIYIVDQEGQIVSHPSVVPQDEIIDISSSLFVQNLLTGERGVEEVQSVLGEEVVVAAYEPVQRYGWSVVVEQPVRTVFEKRDTQLTYLAIIYLLLFLLNIILTLIALRAVEHGWEHFPEGGAQK